MQPTLWTELKTITLATIVAALVWVYAEGESQTTRAVSTIITLPADPSGTLLFRPLEPGWRAQVRVRLEGNTRTIDDAASVLAAGVRLMVGAPGVPTEPGPERTINLREAISAVTELRGLGSTVAEVDPQYVRVDVVRLAVRELPVRVDLALEVPLDGEPVPEPAVVFLKLPEQALRSLPEGTTAVATVSADDLRRLKGDGPQTVPATVRAPAALDAISAVSMSPETISVRLRIRRKVETIRVPTVPVWYSLPPTEDGAKWNVEVLDKFLTDITLTGPSDDIDRIRSGQLPVKAFVELTTNELEKGTTSKAVAFLGLPLSVTPPTPAPVVRLRIARRDGGPDKP